MTKPGGQPPGSFVHKFPMIFRIVIMVMDQRNKERQSFMVVKEDVIGWMKAAISLLLLPVVISSVSAAGKVYNNKDLEKYENRPAKTDPEHKKPSSSDLKSSKISVDFLDAEIYQVLRIIADEAKKKDGIELFVSPEMSGKITIKMIDVPWTHVLKEIEQKHNLAETFLGKRTLLIYQNKL